MKSLVVGQLSDTVGLPLPKVSEGIKSSPLQIPRLTMRHVATHNGKPGAPFTLPQRGTLTHHALHCKAVKLCHILPSDAATFESKQ